MRLGSASYHLVAGQSETLRVKLAAGSLGWIETALGWIETAHGHKLKAVATTTEHGAATLHVNLTLMRSR